jgi:hypothetical protein
MRNIIIESLGKPEKYPIVFTFVFSLIFSIASNGLSNLILEVACTWLETTIGLTKLIWQITIVSVMSIFLFLLISNIKQNFVNWLSGNKKLTTTAPEKLQATFQGLIVFASTSKKPPAEIAIRHHWENGNGNLKHCWVISGNTQGLESAQKMIDNLVKDLQIGDTIFHFKSDYLMIDPEDPKKTINLVPNLAEANDPNIIRKIVEAIYKDAKDQYDLEESDIIADYTGGTKSMTAGITLACAEPSRRLQYIVSEYDENNAPFNSKVMEIKLSYRLKPVKNA